MMIYPLVYLIIWTIPTAIRVRHQDPFGQMFLKLLLEDLSYCKVFLQEPTLTILSFQIYQATTGKSAPFAIGTVDKVYFTMLA